MKTYVKKTRLPASSKDVFQWHQRPGAFGRLTPPLAPVTIIEKTGSIKDGDRLKLQIVQGGIPITAVYEHFDYIENRQFCDRQLKGPFKMWEHKHRFAAIDDQASEMIDEVTFALPWYLGFMAKNIVQKLEDLFDYRHTQLMKDMKAHKGVAAMKIAIAGSSGLIGTALKDFLTTGGHDVIPLVRDNQDGIHWDPKNKQIDAAKLEGFDAVVNLSGENIVSSRWTDKQKRKIRSSRVESTRFLAETIKKLSSPPKVLINASAIGYYGHVEKGKVTESYLSGEGFLASVCEEWEAATECLMGEQIRIVNPRIGVALSPKGGALAKMLTPFKLGLGGVIGSGDQFMSWIDIEDLIRAFYFCLLTDSIHGPVNLTAPNPVTNKTFTKTLGRILKRPTIFPMPALIARLAFGEMADEMLLRGAPVVPEKLLSAGFRFEYQTLEDSLKHLLTS